MLWSEDVVAVTEVRDAVRQAVPGASLTRGRLCVSARRRERGALGAGAPVRECTPNLPYSRDGHWGHEQRRGDPLVRMVATWLRTVFSERIRRRAISWFPQPVATRL